MLESEEYIEQAHFFREMARYLENKIPAQEALACIREEVLSTVKLPLAIDYLLGELKHHGVFSPAMERLAHYFTGFQSYVISEAENERGRFDLVTALKILRSEAEYRAHGSTPQGLFLYQFESLCRNRLGYDKGLRAIAADPVFQGEWRGWILSIRHQVGIVDVADLIYVESDYYWMMKAGKKAGLAEARAEQRERSPLFGESEGRIALANRRKDPLFFFAALHRQLHYPIVPRLRPEQREQGQMIPRLVTRLERLEARIKLLEEEQRSAVDLGAFSSDRSQDRG